MAFTVPLSFRPNSLSKPSLAELRELRKCLKRYLKEPYTIVYNYIYKGGYISAL